METGNQRRRSDRPLQKMGMKLMAWVLARPAVYRFAGKAARWVTANLPFLVKIKPGTPGLNREKCRKRPNRVFRNGIKNSNVHE